MQPKPSNWAFLLLDQEFRKFSCYNCQERSMKQIIKTNNSLDKSVKFKSIVNGKDSPWEVVLKKLISRTRRNTIKTDLKSIFIAPFNPTIEFLGKIGTNYSLVFDTSRINFVRCLIRNIISIFLFFWVAEFRII